MTVGVTIFLGEGGFGATQQIPCISVVMRHTFTTSVIGVSDGLKIYGVCLQSVFFVVTLFRTSRLDVMPRGPCLGLTKRVAVTYLPGFVRNSRNTRAGEEQQQPLYSVCIGQRISRYKYL